VVGLLRREPSATAGVVAGVALVIAVTGLIVPVRGDVSRATPTVALVLPVVVAGIIGGRAASLLTAIRRRHRPEPGLHSSAVDAKINSVDDAVALVVFGVVALVVGR